jgi:hypothetical protein
LSSSSGDDDDIELEGVIRPLEDDKDASRAVNDMEAMMGSFKVCLMPLYQHVLMC